MIETIYGKTPNGGDYSKAFYINDDGDLVEVKDATKIIIHEYSKDGKLIQETIALTNRRTLNDTKRGFAENTNT